jgi:hypothetical protein
MAAAPAHDPMTKITVTTDAKTVCAEMGHPFAQFGWKPIPAMLISDITNTYVEARVVTQV